VVFTYGDTVYNPNNIPISDDLKMHELTHADQQGHNDKDAKKWWEKYFTDPQFRFLQELEAYQNQYRFFCGVIHDRNRRAKFLMKIAGDLSSALYGDICTQSQAMEMIRK
jgi:hypothetical protein